MFVKICGITRLEDARAAIAHGAAAVGFVFWPGSPRAMTPGAVRTIVDALPAETMRVGVFVNQPAEDVNDAAEAAGLTHVQLHGDETPLYATTIMRPVIKATSLETGVLLRVGGRQRRCGWSMPTIQGGAAEPAIARIGTRQPNLRGRVGCCSPVD